MCIRAGGDCFFTSESIKYLGQLRLGPGHIRYINLVLGNHDTQSADGRVGLGMSMNSHLLNQVHGLVKYKSAWLSHAPLHPDELRGKMNIHGHCHSRAIQDSRYFCVSCEQVDYTPQDMTKILAGPEY